MIISGIRTVEKYQIFIDAETTLEALAQDLNRLLAIRLKLSVDEIEPDFFWFSHWYVSYGMRLTVREITSFPAAACDDAEYAYYRFETDIWSQRRHRKRRDRFVSRLFEKLKATGRYRLLLVADLFTRVTEFAPDPPPASHAYPTRYDSLDILVDPGSAELSLDALAATVLCLLSSGG